MKKNMKKTLQLQFIIILFLLTTGCDYLELLYGISNTVKLETESEYCYTGDHINLSCSTTGELKSENSYNWDSIEAGTISYHNVEDHSKVFWQAPTLEGSYTVQVTVEFEHGTEKLRKASKEIHVYQPRHVTDIKYVFEDAGIKLSWKNPEGPMHTVEGKEINLFTKVHVYRNVKGSSEENLKKIYSGAEEEYTDIGVSAGETYQYVFFTEYLGNDEEERCEERIEVKVPDGVYLESLVVDGADITFASEELEYEDIVGYKTDHIRVKPVKYISGDVVSVRIGGQEEDVASGDWSDELFLNVGMNSIFLTVTDQEDANISVTYELKIERKNAEVKLRELGLQYGGVYHAVSGFSGETEEYEVSVGKDIALLKVKPTAEDSQMTEIYVQDGTESITSGELSGEISLEHGEQDITVKVCWKDEPDMFKAYTVHVTRAGLSSNVHLGSLSVEGYGLKPEFNRDVKQYEITGLKYDEEEVVIRGEAEDSEAVVYLEGGESENPVLNETVEFESDGSGSIQLVVRAEDGSKQVYSLVYAVPEKPEIKHVTVSAENYCYTGDTIKIYWESAEEIEYVDIILINMNDYSYLEHIVSYYADIGEYEFLIPMHIEENTKYRIKVLEHVQNGNEEQAEAESPPFVILKNEELKANNISLYPNEYNIDFHKDKNEYTAEVGKNCDSLLLDVTVDNEKTIKLLIDGNVINPGEISDPISIPREGKTVKVEIESLYDKEKYVCYSIRVQREELDRCTDLKQIKLNNNGELFPFFDVNRTHYTIEELQYTDSYIDIELTAKEETAEIAAQDDPQGFYSTPYKKRVYLNPGDAKMYEFYVKAENGDTQTYVFDITVPEKPDIVLEDLPSEYREMVYWKESSMQIRWDYEYLIDSNERVNIYICNGYKKLFYCQVEIDDKLCNLNLLDEEVYDFIDTSSERTFFVQAVLHRDSSVRDETENFLVVDEYIWWNGYEGKQNFLESWKYDESKFEGAPIIPEGKQFLQFHYLGDDKDPQFYNDLYENEYLREAFSVPSQQDPHIKADIYQYFVIDYQCAEEVNDDFELYFEKDKGENYYDSRCVTGELKNDGKKHRLILELHNVHDLWREDIMRIRFDFGRKGISESSEDICNIFNIMFTSFKPSSEFGIMK